MMVHSLFTPFPSMMQVHPTTIDLHDFLGTLHIYSETSAGDKYKGIRQRQPDIET
jgi:hypothetical protein